MCPSPVFHETNLGLNRLSLSMALGGRRRQGILLLPVSVKGYDALDRCDKQELSLEWGIARPAAVVARLVCRRVIRYRAERLLRCGGSTWPGI